MSHPEAVAKSVAILAATFQVDADEMLLESYKIGLRELTPEQIEQATAIALRHNKFMPKPVELIELARTQGVGYQSQALLAFEQLEHALNENKPSLMPPLVAAVAKQLGTFSELREMPVEAFRTWKRKDFLAAYESLSRESPERLAAITGPTSSIVKALHDQMKKLPSREEVAAIEAENRQKLISLAAPAQGLESE